MGTPDEETAPPAPEWVSLTRAQQLDLPLFGGARAEDPLYSMAPQEVPGVQRPNYVVGPHRAIAPPEMFMFGRRPGAAGGGLTHAPASQHRTTATSRWSPCSGIPHAAHWRSSHCGGEAAVSEHPSGPSQRPSEGLSS